MISFRRAAIAAPLGLLASSLAAAEGHHHHGGGEAGPLHFTHPLVAESPTPDRKIHLGYRFDAADELDSHELHLHAEYSWHPAISVGFGQAWSMQDDGHETEAGLGNLHFGVKTANFAFAEHGVVITAAFGVVAPIGDDDIQGHHGGDHWTLEPVLGGGWRNADWEVVALGRFSLPVDQDEPDDEDHHMMMMSHHEETRVVEERFGFNASLMRHLPAGWSVVIELQGESILAGDEAGDTEVEAIVGGQVHPPGWPGVGLGAGVAVPLEDGERDVALLASAMWHY